MDRLSNRIVSFSRKKVEKMKKAEEQKVKSAYRQAEYETELVKGRLNKLEEKKRRKRMIKEDSSMYAFLEDCPLGFEDEGLIIEACTIEAEKSNVALDMYSALQDINRRKALLKRDSSGIDFNAMMSFYEEEDNKEAAEKKEGLIKKAWNAIVALARKIRDFFKNLFKKKIPEGTYEGRAETPTLLEKAAEMATSVKNMITLKTIDSVMAAGKKASLFLDWIDNVWMAKTGKKTKRYQKKEVERLLAAAQEAEDKYTTLCETINDKDIEQGYAKEWEHDKAKIAAEKEKLTEKLKDISAGGVWGLLRKAVTAVLNKVKEAAHELYNKVFNKDSEEGEDPADGSGKNDDDEKKETSQEDEPTEDKPAEGGEKSGDKAEDNSSDTGDNKSSDDTDPNKPKETHEEDGDGLAGDGVFDAIMESIDEILGSKLPEDSMLYEGVDVDSEYDAEENAEDAMFEGYDISDIDTHTSEFAEEQNEFDTAFEDYLAEDSDFDTSHGGFGGIDCDGDEIDEEAWEEELTALCNELMDD